MTHIPTVKFNNEDNVISGLGLDLVKTVVFDNFIPNLERAIIKNKKNVVACYADQDYKIIVNREDFPNVLDIMEAHYVSKEDFNICIKLRDLKFKL